MSEASELIGSIRPDEQNYIVPVRMNDMSIFDGAFTFMKQRFAEEMRRMEDEMTKFSKNLMNLYGDTKAFHAGLTNVRESASQEGSIANSPLIEGDGEDKRLRLQFDVSQFEPDEVIVKIFDENLVVSAQHREKTDSSTVYNEYYREFMLPPGTDPETVESALSKDGILTVRAPLRLASETIQEGSYQ